MLVNIRGMPKSKLLNFQFGKKMIDLEVNIFTFINLITIYCIINNI